MSEVFRAYVGTPHLQITHLDQGRLSWRDAHDQLREFVDLYTCDDREYMRRQAADVMEVLDDPWMIGRPMLFDIDGEWHAIMRDYPRPRPS